jgi:uncharacterized protein DUF4277
VSVIRPVAHLPLLLGILWQFEVATSIDGFLPPHPDNVLSGGHGGEALVLAMLDGHHALYKVGTRWEEHGLLALPQRGLARESLNDYRTGRATCRAQHPDAALRTVAYHPVWRCV